LISFSVLVIFGVSISDVVILPGLRPLDGVAGTGAPPDISKTVTIMSLLFLWH